MPSKAHESKIEEIRRDVESRGLQWKTRKAFPIWLPNENVFGLIDIVAFKKAENNYPAIVEGYEVEESSGSLQQKRNLEKLKQLESSFPSNVRVKTCQLSASENHKQKCFRKPFNNNKPQFKRRPVSWI